MPLPAVKLTTPPVWVNDASRLFSPNVKKLVGLMLSVPAAIVIGPPESVPTLKRFVTLWLLPTVRVPLPVFVMPPAPFQRPPESVRAEPASMSIVEAELIWRARAVEPDAPA